MFWNLLSRNQPPGPSRHNLADLIAVGFGKPYQTIWSDSNSCGLGVGGGNRKLRYDPNRGDTADFIALDFGEPQIPVRTSDDAVRSRVPRRHREDRDSSAWGYAHDYVIEFPRTPKRLRQVLSRSDAPGSVSRTG
jgi:hypothetical protein